MKISLLIASASFLLGVASAASETPRFENFAVAEEKIVRSVTPRLDDPTTRQYAAVLCEGARHKPNFAGHFVLVSWGCGASCIMSAAINLKNGSVIWLPFTICCWDINVEPLEFRLLSRLIKVNWYKNEIEDGASFYGFDGEHFNLIDDDKIRK
jgi:hypothetical protein